MPNKYNFINSDINSLGKNLQKLMKKNNKIDKYTKKIWKNCSNFIMGISMSNSSNSSVQKAIEISLKRKEETDKKLQRIMKVLNNSLSQKLTIRNARKSRIQSSYQREETKRVKKEFLKEMMSFQRNYHLTNIKSLGFLIQKI